MSVSSLLISVTPFLLTRPGPGHAAVLCSELCKLGPGLKYRMLPWPRMLLQSPVAGVYVKNPGDHGTEWAQVFAESPRSAAAGRARAGHASSCSGGPCTFQLVFGGRGRSFSWTGGDFRAGLGHFWGRVCVSMAAGKRFRGVRNFSAGGCRQLFPGCAWLPAKSTAAAGITWAAARPMAAADCRDVRPMGGEDPRWTCDSCCGMRPCDSCCLGQRSIAPGRRGTAPGRATG